jgi:hypothetical protein
MYKSSNIFIFFLKLYMCYAFLSYNKSQITQQKTHFSFQFTQHSSARIYATQLNKPAIPFSCGIGISQRAPDYSLGDHYSALQLTTMLDKPAQQHFSYGTGTNKRALNYRVGNRYPVADNTSPMLDVPAQLSPTLDFPAHLAYFIRSNGPPLWTQGCINSGPSNPHDPGPSATVHSEFLQSNLTLDIPAQTMPEALAETLKSASLLLWTLELIGPRPSNPHDPGPSASVADYTLTSFFHLILTVIAMYALIDFLRTSPRSPSPSPVFLCTVCL